MELRKNWEVKKYVHYVSRELYAFLEIFTKYTS